MKFGTRGFSRALISKMALKFWSEHFLAKKLGLFRECLLKITEIETLSHFDEIWFMRVFEVADSKNRINFYLK